jgi:hypothetical protein
MLKKKTRQCKHGKNKHDKIGFCLKGFKHLSTLFSLTYFV